MISNRAVHEFVLASLALAGIIIFGVVLFALLENWSILDSLYFTVTTVFTVGFGDLVPSEANRAIVGFYILAFCTIAFACSSLIGQGLISFIHNKIVVHEIKHDISEMSKTLEELKKCEGELCSAELEKLKDELQKIEDELLFDISKEF